MSILFQFLFSLHNNQLYVYGGKNDPSAEYCLPGLYVYDIGK